MAAARFPLDAHLARLESDGYTIIPDFLGAQGLRAVRDGLAAFLGRHRGGNNFEGHAGTESERDPGDAERVKVAQ